MAVSPSPDPADSGFLGLSPDQLRSAARWLASTIGTAVATYAITHGMVTKDQAAAILANPAVANYGTTIVLAGFGALVGVGTLIKGLFVHKKVNLVATVDAMPEVVNIEMKPTEAGVALANAAAPLTPGSVIKIAA